jgi:hypothetical protein
VKTLSQDDDVTKFFKDLDTKFRKFFDIPPKKDANAPSAPVEQPPVSQVTAEQPPAASKTPVAPSPEGEDLLTTFSSQVQDTFAKWQEDAKKRNEEFKLQFKDGTDKMKTQIQQNNEKIKNFFDDLGKKWNSQYKTWQEDIDKKSAQNAVEWETNKQKMRQDWEKFVDRSRKDYDKAVNFNFKMSMKIWMNILLFLLPIILMLWLLSNFVFPQLQR